MGRSGKLKGRGGKEAALGDLRKIGPCTEEEEEGQKSVFVPRNRTEPKK